jgi:quinol monooxygenase YgiN
VSTSFARSFFFVVSIACTVLSLSVSVAAAPHSDVYHLDIYTTPADRKPQLMAVVNTYVSMTQREPGAERIFSFEDKDAPGTVYIFEHWRSERARATHLARPETRLLARTYGSGGAKPPESLSLTDQFPTLSSFAKGRTTPVLADPSDFFVFLQSKPEDYLQFFEKIEPQMREAQKLPQTTLFYVFSIAERPNSILIFECWTSESVHQRHLHADYMRDVNDFAKVALTAPSTLIHLAPLRPTEVCKL